MITSEDVAFKVIRNEENYSTTVYATVTVRSEITVDDFELRRDDTMRLIKRMLIDEIMDRFYGAAKHKLMVLRSAVMSWLDPRADYKLIGEMFEEVFKNEKPQIKEAPSTQNSLA